MDFVKTLLFLFFYATRTTTIIIGDVSVGTSGDFLGTSGDLWDPLGTSGDFWGPLGTPWGPLGTSGISWGHHRDLLGTLDVRVANFRMRVANFRS